MLGSLLFGCPGRMQASLEVDRAVGWGLGFCSVISGRGVDRREAGALKGQATEQLFSY